MRNKQHFVWLRGDNLTLCGKEDPSRRAITPTEWFPISHDADCPVCIRAVRAHFFSQRRLVEFDKLCETI